MTDQPPHPHLGEPGPPFPLRVVDSSGAGEVGEQPVPGPNVDDWPVGDGYLPRINEEELRDRVRPQIEKIRKRAIAVDKAKQSGQTDPDKLLKVQFHMAGAGKTEAALMAFRRRPAKDDSVDRMVAASLDRVIESIAKQARGTTEPTEQELASATNLLYAHLLGRVENRHPERSINRVETTLRGGELHLRRWRDRPVRSPKSPAAWATSIWYVLGFFITVVMAVFIVLGMLWLAVIALSARLSISLLLEPPYPTVTTTKRTHSSSISGCVSGHMSDLVGLGAVAMYLATNERIVWAVAASLGLVIVAGGTIHRLAAIQEADYVPRLVLERLVRNGSLLFWLVTAALFQATIPSQSLPLIALAIAAPAIYGLLEQVRVVALARANDRHRDLLTREAQIAHEEQELRAGLSPSLWFAHESHQSRTGQRISSTG